MASTLSAHTSSNTRPVSIPTAQKRFRLRKGDLFLHLSGQFLTTDRKWAWIGSLKQARNTVKMFPHAKGLLAEEYTR